MINVFIGGSRSVSRLNPAIRKELDNLIAQNCMILVGDANGADKAVQKHFLARDYPHVTVYCMRKCRNNLGSWLARQVSGPKESKDFAYYAAKDHAMAQDANCGVMLWDAKSKGTLNNIQNLIRSGKKCLVYLAPGQTFHKVYSRDDLNDLLNRCDPSVIESAQREIHRKLGARGQLSLHPTTHS